VKINSAILVLSLAALVPSFLAGHAVYHCRTTGTDGLACPCEPVRSSAGPARCEAAPASRAGDPQASARSLVHDADCDCCDVTRLRWVGAKPDPDPTCPSAMAGPRADPVDPPVSARGRSARLGRGAPPREPPPLFLLHCSFLC